MKETKKMRNICVPSAPSPSGPNCTPGQNDTKLTAKHNPTMFTNSQKASQDKQASIHWSSLTTYLYRIQTRAVENANTTDVCGKFQVANKSPYSWHGGLPMWIFDMPLERITEWLASPSKFETALEAAATTR